jgi:hypothetical protein
MVSVKLRGGLGNQLFQIAAAVAHAKSYSLQYAIPETVDQPHAPGAQPYRLGKIQYTEKLPESINTYLEPAFHYTPIPPRDNICLDGYFQSAKYFNEFSDEIIDLFEMNIPRILKGWCGVHVRRGDYLRMQEYHPPVSMIYVMDAMGVIAKKTGCVNFLFFSDEIEWCRSNFSELKYYTEFRVGYSDIEDLIAYGSCAHQIGSNSSFSWWGHYLNPNPDKIGVFPKKWFGPLLPHNLKDLFLPTMYVI